MSIEVPHQQHFALCSPPLHILDDAVYDPVVSVMLPTRNREVHYSNKDWDVKDASGDPHVFVARARHWHPCGGVPPQQTYTTSLAAFISTVATRPVPFQINRRFLQVAKMGLRYSVQSNAFTFQCCIQFPPLCCLPRPVEIKKSHVDGGGLAFAAVSAAVLLNYCGIRYASSMG